MKNFILGVLVTWGVCMLWLYGTMSYKDKVEPIQTSGLGVIELSIGCDNYYEWGVVNKDLYDSLVIKVNRSCTLPPPIML